jgi:hypothetical protein
MSERSALLRALRAALRESTRPGGLLHPHLDLPRITVFDSPPGKRPRIKKRIFREPKPESVPAQLKLL